MQGWATLLVTLNSRIHRCSDVTLDSRIHGPITPQNTEAGGYNLGCNLSWMSATNCPRKGLQGAILGDPRAVKYGLAGCLTIRYAISEYGTFFGYGRSCSILSV